MAFDGWSQIFLFVFMCVILIAFGSPPAGGVVEGCRRFIIAYALTNVLEVFDIVSPRVALLKSKV